MSATVDRVSRHLRSWRWAILPAAVGVGVLVSGCQAPVHDFTVTSTQDAPAAVAGDGSCASTLSSGDCTLRSAIDEANATDGVVNIRLPEATYTLTRVGDDDTNHLGDLDVSGHINLIGPGVVDAGGIDRAFDVTGSLTLAVTTVRGGDTAGAGGAVRVRNGGAVHLVLSTLEDNTAATDGGALAVEPGGSAVVRSSTISTNTAGRSGGGIHVAPGGSGTLINSTISANTAVPDSLDVVAEVSGTVTEVGDPVHLDEPMSDPPDGTTAAPIGPDGLVPVIVELHTDPLAPAEPGLDLARRAQQIRGASDQAIERLDAVAGSQTVVNRTYANVPLVALSTDAAGLAALEDDPAVAAVHPDELAAASLDQSVPHIGAATLQAAGNTGAGTTIAIIDSGVDPTKPMTDGQVIGGACFARGEDGALNGVGDCPGGGDSAFGVAAGVHCPWFDGTSGCGHGTHVASTAAGATRLVNGVPHTGVAPGAAIISVNVFSRFTTETTCGTGRAPCIRTWTSDQIAALDWLIPQIAATNLVAANMSLGGGSTATYCNTDSRASVIATLRQQGVLTVAASGNSGAKNGVGAPACIADAVAVGATFAAADSVAGFSQSAEPLDLLAPGVQITAEFPRLPDDPDDYVSTSSGTSMAAPHVAGAVALLAEAGVTSPDDIEEALTTTGVPVTDSNGLTRPRIDVTAAVALATGAGAGGGIANDGELSMHYSTLTANAAWWGGGFHTTTSASAAGTIIASQSAGNNCSTGLAGVLSSGGHNLASDLSCWSGGSDLSGANPLLGALALNGGPTRTHLPGVGSPAREAIPFDTAPLCTGTGQYNVDQRGTARPVGASCDIGSVEQ